MFGGAAALLVWGIGVFGRSDGWSETVGTVIEVRRDGDDWDTTIRFRDSDGIEYTFDSQFGHRGTAEGEQVGVRYPPRDPARAETSADSADVRNHRVVALVVGGLLGPAGVLQALFSLGLIGKHRGWFEPDDSPPRTDAAFSPDLPSRQRWSHRQAESVEREINRVPLEDQPQNGDGQSVCRACGRERAMTVVSAWRSAHKTLRCTHCLWWHQAKSTEWFDPDDWPPRGVTHYSSAQAESVERELNRVPVKDQPAPNGAFARRCRACGRQRAMTEVPDWRHNYKTRRCIYCLWWHQPQ